MSWAQRLKRVFNIDIETCSQCGGIVKVLACIEDSTVIKKSLSTSTTTLNRLKELPILPELHPRQLDGTNPFLG